MHVAQILGYIDVTKEERDKSIDILQEYVQSSESKIVITFAMQTLADFALRVERLCPKIIQIVETMKGSSPAVMNREKKFRQI